MGIMKLAKILASLAMFALVATPAHAYDIKDAAYVTTSKNVDVLFYIVCLQKRNSRQPRALSAKAALNKAVAGCQNEMAKLPKKASQPSANDIKQSILECGFQLSDASPDMDCGGANPRVLVTKSLGITSVLQLDGAAICIDVSSKLEKPIATYFKKNKIKYIPLALVNSTEARKSYDAGLCDALLIDGADVAREISQLKAPSKHLILPDSLGSTSHQTPSSVKAPSRPKRKSGTTVGGRKVSGNTAKPRRTPVRPSRPGATSQRPSKISSATPRRRTTTKPTRPSRPGAAASTRSGFPIIAESRGSNIRSVPRANGKKLGSSKSGQPVTLLANVGNKFKGYPWFKIRMNNGTVGYQWGGGLCAKARTLVSGTKGTCKVQVTKRKQPTSGKSTSSRNKSKKENNGAADVIVSVLDLVGKLIENGNNKNTKADAAIFTQNLNVSADGPYVMASRNVVKDKDAALYTVRGKKGQILNVDVWSPKGNVVFAIYDGQASLGGRTLRGAGQDDNIQSFRDELPRNGKYQILVGSVNGTDKFELSVALDSAVSAPVAIPGPVYSGGTVALNRRTVGTYTSKTATSGNIELNEAANALTWTTFCGPTVVLAVDWTNNLLLPNSGKGALELKMSKKGKVRSFTYNGHKYTKNVGIIMPGCVSRPSSAASTNGAPTKPAPVAVIYWADNPKDPRVNRNYDKVHMAWWGICEKENYDPNSSTFNNEKAYWDCADAGQIDGGGRLTAPTVAKPGVAPVDPRETKNYSAVSDPAENACSIKYPTSLPDDKGYYDCMDVALKVAFTSRPTAPTKPQVADPRVNKDYSKVPHAAASLCEAANPISPADDKGFFDCMDVALKAGLSAPATKPVAPKPAVPDPRSNKNYNQVSSADSASCEAAHPNSPADDKEFYDCMDLGIANKLNSLKGAINLSDADAMSQFPLVTTPDLAGCKADVMSGTSTFNGPGATNYENCLGMLNSMIGLENKCLVSSTKGTPKFQACMRDAMDAATPGTTPAIPSAPKPVTPDPRANKNYSNVPNAAASLCEVANPNSPADDKDFYDCMDISLNAAPAAPKTAAPDPRVNKDYSKVPQAASSLCEAANPNSPADDKDFYDCMDISLNAAPAAPKTAAPDPRVNKDYSKVPQAASSLCEAANPNSPADDKGFFDCMDIGLNAVPAAPKTAAPDPRVNKDYSKVPQAASSLCEAANPNSPADDKGFFDCMDIGLNAATAAPKTAAPDPRANNDYSRVPQAAASSCEAANPNSPADDIGFYDCMDVADMNALEELEDAAGADQDNGGVPNAPVDQRSTKEYATVNGDEWNACWAQEATGGQSVVYDCLDAYEAAASNNSGTTTPVNDNQADVNNALTEIQNYCGGNDQCYADLESCYYQHGTLDSQAFEQCAATWDKDANNQQSQDTQPANDNQADVNDALAEIQSYCGGNDQCFAELESCYYQHGSLETSEFEQCGAAWQ